jgi:hypothetical protein
MDHRMIENSVFLVSHKYLYYGETEYEYRRFIKRRETASPKSNISIMIQCIILTILRLTE